MSKHSNTLRTISNKQPRRPLHDVKVAGKLDDNDTAITAAATTTTILPHIPLPASIRNVLLPHQITGVDFLYQKLTQKGGCILGDEMGLGVA